MPTYGLISTGDAERLAEPHICRAILLVIEMPGGDLNMHNGVGTITVNGVEYRGVSYPEGGRVVRMGVIPQPEFGQAAAVEIILCGADVAFFKQMRDLAPDIEGLPATLYWCLFDQETQQLEKGPFAVFPRATISAPKLQVGPQPGLRNISINIEGPFADLNFPALGRWSRAGQRGRYAGDAGMDLMGVDVQEVIKP